MTPIATWLHISQMLALGTPPKATPSPDQPMPTPGKQDVTPIARSLFLALMEQREAKGIATYGTTLQTHNGRNAFLDLAEELADAWQYAVQASIEHDDLVRRLRQVEAELDAVNAEIARLRGQTP